MRDLTSVVSSVLYVLGYTCFCLGVTTHRWRTEVGYWYGVWYRCDEVECTSLLDDTSGYLLLVQCGIAGAFLLLTVSTVGVAVCDVIKLSKARRRHIQRTNKVICLTAATGDILAAASLFLYGYKTVLARERYPSLMWGFAVTGLGVALSLMGNIVRIMGPVSTWDNGLSCLLPKRSHAHHMIVYSDGSGTYSGDSSESHPGSERLINSKTCRRKCRNKSGATRNGNGGCCCTSGQSSDCGASEINYRHYEEISFEDMPPPPFELLHPPAHDFAQVSRQVNTAPGPNYDRRQISVPRNHLYSGSGPNFGHKPSSVHIAVHQQGQGPRNQTQPGAVLSFEHQQSSGSRHYSQGMYLNSSPVYQAHETHQPAGNVPHYSKYQSGPSQPPPPPPPPPPLPQTMTSQYHRDTSTTEFSRSNKPTPKARQQHQARNHGASTLPPSYTNTSYPSNTNNASRTRPRRHGEAMHKTRTLPPRT